MTQKLGDAFLGQQKEVMAAIQVAPRRRREGNLKSSKDRRCRVRRKAGQRSSRSSLPIPGGVFPTTTRRGLRSVPYPTYPPYVLSARLRAGRGVVHLRGGACRRLQGGCNWGRWGVYINHNNYNNFNKTNIKNGDWNHNAEHRKGTHTATAPASRIRERPRKGAQRGKQNFAAAPSRDGKKFPVAGLDGSKGIGR